MKKFIVFIIVVLLLCGASLGYTNELSFEKIFAGADVEVYLPSKYDVSYKSIQNGEGMIIYCKIDDLEHIKNTYYINGYTIKISKEMFADIIPKLKPCYLLDINGYTYGYLSGINNCVDICQKKVNFQYEENGGEVVMGFPLLLGSY